MGELFSKYIGPIEEKWGEGKLSENLRKFSKCSNAGNDPVIKEEVFKEIKKGKERIGLVLRRMEMCNKGGGFLVISKRGRGNIEFFGLYF